MSDLSLLELCLLSWAIVVTGFLIDAKLELRMAKRFVLHFIENDEDREQMVRECKKAKAEFEASINKP